MALARAVSRVYYLLCSLQQGEAEHTTNLCHYSVIASNHMISSWGSGGGLLGAAGRRSPQVMVRWHCDGGLCAVLHTGPRMHHHSACWRWPQGESCSLLLSPLTYVKSGALQFPFQKILLIGSTSFLGHAIINMGSDLFGNRLYCELHHRAWICHIQVCVPKDGDLYSGCKKNKIITKPLSGIRSSLCRST